jgi:hypothetical protein
MPDESRTVPVLPWPLIRAARPDKLNAESEVDHTSILAEAFLLAPVVQSSGVSRRKRVRS